ncbi:MAG: Fe-S cluster assembly ATPase SufC [Patescibacteria group bacterium]
MKQAHPVLVLDDIRASIETKEILHGVSFTVKPSEVHAIMGPNGSGKSTLASALLGHPSYVCKGSILLGTKNVIKMAADERAKMGLFLAFQSPIAIPGVSVMNLLRTAYQSIYKVKESGKIKQIQNSVLANRFDVGGMPIGEFTNFVKAQAKALSLDIAFLSRGIHDGFSGGEKKKLEMLQALVLKPKYAVFDEIDTGLDVDALKVVSIGISELQKNGTGVIIITHYNRILKYVTPDVVHILVKGVIVKTGKAILAKYIEKNGYSDYETTTS